MDADFLLIHKMKNGDEEAIEVFVKKYYSTIRNYCRLHTYTDCDAEDITQATFEHFFRSFRSYHHLGKTANYLYVIARNLCRDSYVCLLSVFLITSTFVLQIAFMDILIQFILPMNVTCCICFRLLCSKGDDYVSSTLFSCLIWIAVWTLVVLKDSIYEHISTSIWCGMMILSVLYLCYSIWRVWKCSERYYESNGASV